MSAIRDWAWKNDPKLDLFRFSLYKYALPEDPDILLTDKYWWTIKDDNLHAYFE